MRIRLKSLEVTEKGKEGTEIEFDDLSISDFNLLISDNAQGKTRLFNVINFLATIFKDKPRTIPTDFFAKLSFDAINSTEIDEVSYEININPINGENNFSEHLAINKKVIYSAKEKLLFNETSGKEVKNYFIPKNLPAISSINEPDFITVNLLREFFQRIVPISSSKSRDITLSPDSVHPYPDGTNIASVLNNWSQTYPERFNEVVNELKHCFPFIKKIFFSQQDIKGVMKAGLLTFNENNIKKDIKQLQWSDGIYRILHLLMAPKIPFHMGEEMLPPSLILIDEIENGLDFKSLKYIINYFQDYSDESQIIISSHSPLVCDFVHPKNWIVVKRNGSNLSFISPRSKEKDLDSQLDMFKQKHWDFYTKHISNSEDYQA